MAKERQDGAGAGSFLSRLARDIRGNTLAIMGAAIIPLIGIVGGGVDLSRMYIVKTRLQHACDAGALAGRKTMGGGTWSQTVSGTAYYPRVTAERYFDANYNSAAYGATGVTRTFAESAGKVTGTVAATVPMTLMRVFGRTTETLSISCDAEMRLPNTDVMFVLDTTKSMICAPSATTMYCADAGSGSRMVALRTAVKCFYEVVARLDTDVTCATGTPSGGTGDQVQIRFGFVPYATNVNVGKLLPTGWFASSHNYQTRQFVQYNWSNGTATSTAAYSWNSVPESAWSDKQTSVNSNSSSNCAGWTPADTTPSNGTQGGNYNDVTTNGTPAVNKRTTTYNRDTPVTKYTYRYDSYTTTGTDRCLYDRAQVSGTKTDSYTRVDTGTAQWNYGSYPVNIGLLKNGTAWRNSFDWQVADDGGNSTITWDGCIEERETTRTTNFSPIPSAAKDLDIDLVPNSEATRWKPALPRMIFTRDSTGGTNYNGSSWGGMSTSGWDNNTATGTTADYGNGTSYSCPTEARKLQAWPDADDFDDYVDSLEPDGATYHDIGILWGARFMSPTGIFSSENAFTSEGGEIERHMIFMTDGDTNANDYDYAAYGLPYYDRRQTAVGSVPTKDQLDAQVNSRFLALCTAVKNKNITLWVISFGASVNSDSSDRLELCATPGRFFTAADATALQTTFRSIADQISQLRLTR